MKGFKRVVYKLCKTCSERKLSLFFHRDMRQTCLSCLNGQTPEEFRANINVRRNQKKKRIVSVKVGSAESKRGYLYLLYSKSLNIYKVGKSNNPLRRVEGVRVEYGVGDFNILCVGNPIGDAFRVEAHIHRTIKYHKVKMVKPNGGMANELFSCSLPIIADVFLEVMQEATWFDTETYMLINMNIPKLDQEKLKRNTRSVYKRPERVYANGELKLMSKIRSKRDAVFNLIKSGLYSSCKCYATGDRDDALFEFTYDKMGACVSLGVFKDYNEGYSVHSEFKKMIKKERKAKRKYINRRLKSVLSHPSELISSTIPWYILQRKGDPERVLEGPEFPQIKK